MSENVVICCAEEDEPALAPVVSALLERGCTPEVLAGIDIDPMRLGRFMDGHDNGTLYVLCESARFRRRSILQAEGMFGARKGPGDELVRVMLDSGPEAIAARILGGRGAGGTHAPHKPEGGREGGIQREVLGAGTPAAGAPSGWSRQSAAHRAAAISRGQSGPAAQASGGAVSPAAAARQAPTNSNAPTRRAAPPPSEGEDFDVDMDSRRNAPADSRAPTSVSPSPAPAPEARSGSGVLVLIVLLIVAGAAAYLVSKERDARKSGGTAQRGAPGVAVAADTDAGAAEAGDAPAGESADELDDDEGDDGDDDGGSGEQPPVTLNPGEDTDSLREAIDSGDLRVLDLMYVAAAPLHDFDYPGAEAHCAGLEVGGIRGFRLPGPNELKRIRRSHMLDRGRFWTNKPAGEGFAYVLDTEARPSIGPGRKKFGGVRAVCVKER